jgi:hypothetical protein
MALLACKVETPLRTAGRIFGAVIVTLVLLLGILATVRPTAAQGPRMALSGQSPLFITGSKIAVSCLTMANWPR